jgi:hypothetical protein
MIPDIRATTWVYILVQNLGDGEQIVGQHDKTNDIAFIPMFLDKESAMQGVLHMALKKSKKLEIQAIIYEDLENYAAQGSFILFVLDAEGRIIDKKVPDRPLS